MGYRDEDKTGLLYHPAIVHRVSLQRGVVLAWTSPRLWLLDIVDHGFWTAQGEFIKR